MYMGALEKEVGVEGTREGMKRGGGGKSPDLLCNCCVLLCTLSLELNGMTNLFRMGPMAMELIKTA